jgi:hypothetical protein
MIEMEPPPKPLTPEEKMGLLVGAGCWLGAMLATAWFSGWMTRRGLDPERSERSR